MSVQEDFKSIFKRNKFHARIVVSTLYLEYCMRSVRYACILTFFIKIIRKILIQGIYHCEINPCSFINGSAIATLRLPHPFLIIVHGNAKIGKNATIFHNVTVGVIEGGG